jgi:nucleoside-diphosphate-sugar epimerase
MKILITGGLGFIGHNLANSFDKLGHTVVVTDNRTNYGVIPKEELDYIITERKNILSENVFIHSMDICMPSIDALFETYKFDIVVHTASFPRQKVVNTNPMQGSRVMSEGLLNLLETSKKYNIKKFVYLSSSMVYGSFNTIVDEDYNCKPEGQYGILKLAGENLVKDYSRRNCFSHTIIRPSAVYGPCDLEDRVVSKFILSAMRGETLQVNGQSELLDFTYIDDTVNGIVSATLSDNTNNKTYNISRGNGRTLLEAAQIALGTANGGMLQVNDKDSDYPSRNQLNIQKAQKDFGFDPKIDIESGFKIYYDWLRSSTFYTK